MAETPVYGSQRPRFMTVPATGLSSAGEEAVALAKRAGLVLDPWQQFVLDQGMREDADGNWAAFEVCCNIPRQNGKGGIIEARELWGLFIGGEMLILHSAHQFKTSKVAFRRIVALIKGCPDLHRRVKAYRYTTGEESIELHPAPGKKGDGALLQFIARSGGSGRGFTGDCNIIDEAMFLGDDAMDALMPTMAAIRDPQLWYFGSAGIGAPSVQLSRLRRRALAAVESGVPDPSLAYLEWSINAHSDECGPDCTEHDDPDSDEAALIANPGIGYRLTLDKIAKERPGMSPEGYARERLGVGDYPSEEADAWQVIARETWEALADGSSQLVDPVAFAVDVTPERSHAAIGAAGRTGQSTDAGDVVHLEVIDHRPGTGWVVDRLMELVEKWHPCAVVIDTFGPPSSLIPAVKKKLADKFEETRDPYYEELLIEAKTRDVAGAYGQFIDMVENQLSVHLGQAPLATSLAGASTRPVGDGKTWARRGASVDISPLVAITNAAWGHAERKDVVPEGAPNLW